VLFVCGNINTRFSPSKSTANENCIIINICISRVFPLGQVDEATHDVMTKPRCGLKDKHDFDEMKIRRKRFSTFGECFLWQ
jgi:hypothetical protein